MCAPKLYEVTYFIHPWMERNVRKSSRERAARQWAGYGIRTHEGSHALPRERWDIEVVSPRLVDPRFYHLDTCVAPLLNGDLRYFPEAFDDASRKRIEERCPAEKRICEQEGDAVRFACNAVNMGGMIVLNRISTELAGTLEARGFRVIQLELTEFLKAGGAAKRLVLQVGEMDGANARCCGTRMLLRPQMHSWLKFAFLAQVMVQRRMM